MPQARPTFSPAPHRLPWWFRRYVLRYRRWVAAASAAVAVAAVVLSLRPPPPPSVALAVAAADLPSGHVLTAADLELRDFPPDLRPPGATTDLGRLRGAVVGMPLAAGDLLTDRRLLSEGLLRRLDPDMVAVPVSVTRAQSTLLRPGDLVDVVVSTSMTEFGELVDDRGPAVLTQAAPVLATPPPEELSDAATVVLGVPYAESAAVAAANGRAVSVVIHPQGDGP